MKFLVAFVVLAIVAWMVIGRARAATPAVRVASAAPRSLAEVEGAIRALVRAQGERPEGQLRKEADGAFSGAVDVGSGTRRRVDFAGPNAPGRPGEARMFDLMEELEAASRASEQGPWYYLVVHVRPEGAIDFRYFLERDPLPPIADLGLEEFEAVPAYYYRKRFDAALVAGLSDFEVNSALSEHVGARLAAGAPVPPALRELYATQDWQGDTNNGGLDQYFARRHSWDHVSSPRDGNYPLVRAGLRRIGAHDAAALFDEAIALWAHFHPEVEEARAALGIAPVPRQERSDIGSRYYVIERDLDKQRAAYLRAHPEAFAGP